MSILSQKFRKVLSVGLKVSALSFAFMFAGCNDLLTMPANNSTGGSESKNIACPSGLSATVGKKGTITLNWSPVPNAIYYYIYKAQTNTSASTEFQRCGETTDVSVTSIELKVDPGTAMFFAVAAVDANGAISDISIPVKGTALARPYITSVESVDRKTTVSWYMGSNKAKNTYSRYLRYKVCCYRPGKTEPEKTITITDGNADTVAVFEDLDVGVYYDFTVSAWCEFPDDITDEEVSAKVNKETAISYIPSVPEFIASEGTEYDCVNLFVTLPQKCRVESTDEDHPLMFKIERGVYIEGKDTVFSALPGYTDDDYVVVEGNELKKQTYADSDARWDDYVRGNIVKFRDDTAVLGCQYEYRISTRVGKIESSKSFKSIEGKQKKAIGWRPAEPEISIVNFKDVRDEVSGKKTAATLNFECSWNSMGKASKYVYLIEQTKASIEDPSITESQFVYNGSSLTFASLDSVNQLQLTYTYTDDEEENKKICGYYTYTIHILSADKVTNLIGQDTDTIKAECLISKKENSSHMVYNGDYTAPQITSFEDGYSNKCVINYNVETGYTYKLRRELLGELLSRDIEQPIVIIPLESPNGTYVDKCVNADDVNDLGPRPGKKYAYTLLATKDNWIDVPSNTVELNTLGQPAVRFKLTDLEKASVKVTWEKVYGAEKYKITYTAPSGQGTFATRIIKASELEALGAGSIGGAEDGYIITKVATEGNPTYAIEFTDLPEINNVGDKKTISSLIAGLPSEVTVKAINNKNGDPDADDNTDGNYSEGKAETKTLGPAALNLIKPDYYSRDKLQVSWTAVEGVDWYAVRRICVDPRNLKYEGGKYSDTREDLFVVGRDGTVFVNDDKLSDTAPSSVRFTTSGGKITASFVDEQKAAVGTDQYEVSQSYISWGVDFKYEVIPVKAVLDGASLVYQDPFTDSAFEYKNIQSQTTRTYGYGIDIKASKADFTDGVKIEWKRPSISNTSPCLIFAREAGTANDWSDTGIQVTATPTAGSLAMSQKIKLSDLTILSNNVSDYRTKQLEFMVTYDNQCSDTDATLTAYSKRLNELVEDGEKHNVGYLFTVNKNTLKEDQVVDAQKYGESISLHVNTANYPYAKKPGDGMENDVYCTVYFKNRNKAAGWIKLAEITKKGATFREDDISDANKGSLPGTTATLNKELMAMTLVPDMTDNVAYGAMEVLRETYHYYMIELKRKNSNGDVITAYYGNIDYASVNDTCAQIDETKTCDDGESLQPVKVMRLVTDAEVARCTSLILSDALYQTSIPNMANEKRNSPDGKFHDHCWGGIDDWDTSHFQCWSDENYVHNFMGGLPADKEHAFASDLIVTINKSSSEPKHVVGGNRLYRLPEKTITVRHKDSKNPKASAYTKTVTIGIVNDKFKEVVWTISSFKCGTFTVPTVTKNRELFLKWIPYELGASRGSAITAYDTNAIVYNKNYGWWDE
ncbi:MAG: fibronectin type III domain-containing protein [Treponema sp.]|nr:fibronectin type III domain-containing protein [Treponema sp.]